MYSGLVLVAFCFQIIFLGYLLVHFKARISPVFYFLFVAVLLTTFGTMQMNTARDLESALLANQTAYLGSAFSPFFLTLCVSELCKEKLNKWVSGFSIGLSIAVFALASTASKYDWYYKNRVLVQGNGFSFLRKESGPMHFLFPLYLGFMVIVGIIIIINALRKRRDVSYQTSFCMLASLVISTLGYCVEKIMGFDFEILPFIYCFLELVMVIILHRISLYDIPHISARMNEADKSTGYVLFDRKWNYLASDEVAKFWFGELGELRADSPVRRTYTPFLEMLKKWSDGTAESDQAQYKVGDLEIVAHHSILNEHKHNVVHCITLQDETKQLKYQHLIEDYNKNLSDEVKRRTQSMQDVFEDILISMANIVESRDKNTGGHVKRTSDVVKLFANKLRENENIKEVDYAMSKRIAKAAPLHDFGKIGIPDEVLNKPGKFEPEEYEIMKQHSAKGAEIVKHILQNTDDVKFKIIAENVAHYHHEKWDGTGYPENLAGENIPYEARVMALADVFDALVSKRVYKDSFSYDKAFGIIEESAGSHFDPVLAKEFLKCREELIELYDSYED